MNKKKQEWSDAKCIEIAYRNNFPSIVKDINMQKSITNNFLNFYLSGKVPKGHRLIDILFSAIAIMPIWHEGAQSKMFIWEDSHYSNDGTLFFMNSEDRLRYDIKKVLEKKIDTKLLNEEKESSEEIQGNHNEDLEQDNKNTTEAQDHKRDFQDTAENLSCDEEDLQSVKYNDDKANISKDEINNSELERKPINWFRLKQSNKNTLLEEIEYGPVENAKFCIHCNKVLDNWENSNLQCHLKFFFGVTALVLMRTCGKSVNNLEKYFKTKFIYLNINKGVIPYSPPHKSCIVKSWKALRNKSPDIHIMFAKLVVNSFYIDKYHTVMKYNIFRASVLAHIVNTGMGLIALMQRITLYCNFYEAFESLQSEEIKDSWENVRRFLDKYMTNKNENTYHWARVIAPEQFQELSCKNNYKLAVVLAVFIENLTKSQEVWNAGWTKNKTYDLVSLKKLGNEIYDSYNSKKCAETLEIMFFNKLIV